MGPMDPSMMAGGGQAMPPMDQQTPGDQPDQGGQTDVNAVLDSLKQAVEKCLDGDGFIDMNRLITMWPQVSNVPFDSILQILEQQPELFDQILQQFGLSGITVNGKNMTLDELHSLGGANQAAPDQAQGGQNGPA